MEDMLLDCSSLLIQYVRSSFFFHPLTWIVESVVEQGILYKFFPQILCCCPKILCSFVLILLLLVIGFSNVADPVCLNSEPLDLKFGYQD